MIVTDHEEYSRLSSPNLRIKNSPTSETHRRHKKLITQKEHSFSFSLANFVFESFWCRYVACGLCQHQVRSVVENLV